MADLSRQVIKSEYASINIPEVELSMPPKSQVGCQSIKFRLINKLQTGTISTIEGIITRARDGLLSDQAVRRITDPEGAEKIDKYCEQLDELLTYVGSPLAQCQISLFQWRQTVHSGN